MQSVPVPPVVLTIAGSDCSGGAGLQADLKVFSALGAEGLTAVTAVVAEDTRQVLRLDPVDPETLRAQLGLLGESYRIRALKTGLLPSAGHIGEAARFLSRHRIPAVVDPVLASSSGKSFASPEALRAFREELLPLATLVTPNLPEARVLADPPDTLPPPGLATLLSGKLGTPVLLKGGHDGDEKISADHLAFPGGRLETFSAPRRPGPAPHGTGCILSAAIAAGLALGDPLPAAVARAKRLLGEALSKSVAQPGQLPTLNPAKPYP